MDNKALKNIEDKIYNFKTKNKEGFTDSEIKTLLGDYPTISEQAFNKHLFGNTCMMIDGELVQYHCDIYKALICCLENRDLRIDEWD
ncbi:hypothetical protein EB151_14105 [archaeon]|nr:hypothetical protein [archaeon]